ncbi:MAG TPA: nitroreductase family protein [Candidatus Bathyarchaeia archaeon]|nr:nitroreductase family protein [Candidatus Bathyarchaeia archaeon]
MATRIRGYNEQDLMKMDPDALRAILHERTHHTIEVMIYRIINGKMKKPSNFGRQAKLVLDIWKKRKLPTNAPDLKWCMRYVALADRLNSGRKITIDTQLPTPFSEDEMKTVKKLLYTRRSIRQFNKKRVPDKIIDEILFAGMMAPQGCNLCSTRFIVLRHPEEWKLVQSDIPIEHGVMILVCQDMRIYKVLKFDEYVPHNIYFDAAAAADHMCLMSHALGLGACWLTHGEQTQKRIRKHFGLPETFVSRCHIIVGWPDEAPIKSQRISLAEAIVGKETR